MTKVIYFSCSFFQDLYPKVTLLPSHNIYGSLTIELVAEAMRVTPTPDERQLLLTKISRRCAIRTFTPLAVIRFTVIPSINDNWDEKWIQLMMLFSVTVFFHDGAFRLKYVSTIYRHLLVVLVIHFRSHETFKSKRSANISNKMH